MRLGEFIIVALMCSALTACGGGKDSVPPPDPPAYKEPLIKLTKIRDKIDLLHNEIPAMPSEGTATYIGGVYIAEPSQNDKYGKIELTANFSDASVTGRMDEFALTSGEKIDDYIDVTRGDISNDGFKGTLSGKVNKISVNGQLRGYFHGTNIPAVDGRFTATSKGGGGIKGEFVAEKYSANGRLE